MHFIDILVVVLIDIVVVVVKCLVAVVSVEVDGVGLRYVYRFEGAWNKRHELSEYADTSMPEGGLGEPASWGPSSSRGVVGLHHIRELKSVVIATGYIESTSQSCYTASNVNLWKVRLFSYLCGPMM